ncbi:hypothetical protein BVC80_9067g53 [Macleaya cordata]|uniref:Secreted protein n=1 Tax=Macleaya cordata TaxID=56857 RepID=A0A200PNV7_MACCD|nr:hypothetical protein BVC80_9067g53 [Macleaya cordata]
MFLGNFLVSLALVCTPTVKSKESSGVICPERTSTDRHLDEISAIISHQILIQALTVEIVCGSPFRMHAREPLQN